MVDQKLDRKDLVKIVFELKETDWHSVAREAIWASVVEEDRLFRLENSPFYAFGVSYQDIVFATKIDDSSYKFSSIEKRSGHSTYRVYVRRGINDNEEFDFVWAKLAFFGCTFESIDSQFLSVDIPPHADIYIVYEILEEGRDNGIWDFQEAHVGHKLNKIT